MTHDQEILALKFIALAKEKEGIVQSNSFTEENEPL
jgi:hypothetical protein